MSLKKQVTVKQNIHTTASALVRYAKKDIDFANYFTSLIKQNLPDDLLSPAVPFRAAPFLLPDDIEDAETKAKWLISELVFYPSIHTDPVAQSLMHWADEHESPKNVVLGIVGLAVIGPTLGLVKKKKKRKSQMRVVIHEYFAETASVGSLTEIAHNATISLLGNELAAVGGDANRLDPEMAEWLFSDQLTTLYTNSEADLDGLITSLEKEKLPHFIVKQDSRDIAVAIAPAVNDLFPFGDPF